MAYPYPAIVPLLQFLCTPDDYHRLTSRWDWRNVVVSYIKPEMAYWQVIPRYTYAYCPFCSMQYCEPADTYSLAAWNAHEILHQTLFVYEQYPRPTPCAHFMGIHKFINLHDQVPTEKDYFANHTGEVPYLTPWFFPEDIKTQAVLHALPICRVDRDRFVPSYTVFSLTYFSQKPREVLRRHFQAEAKNLKDDPDYHPPTVHPPWGGDQLYDLAQWAQQGKLGWLDVTQLGLPLRLGQGAELPTMYRQIAGSRRVYTWRNGRLIVRPF